MPGGGRFYATATVNPANLGAGAAGDTEVSLSGVRMDHKVLAHPPSDLEAGLVPITAWVSAVDKVKVRLYNPTAGAIDGAAKTWGFEVFVGDTVPYGRG